MPPRPAYADLPIGEALDEIATSLRDNVPTLIVAPPGAGKTTIVPLSLLDEAWLDGRRIVMLEPRRLATRAAAARMAELLGERIGDTVGYQTRDERRIGADTRIEVVTEGILTRRLQHDPELPGVGAVIFDEVHERNLWTDLGLALTLDAMETIRPELRLVAMSATPDIDALRAVVPGAQVVTSVGRAHPVDIRWAPRQRNDRLERATASAIERAIVHDDGDVLAFLPGIADINRTRDALTLPPGVEVHRLSGSVSYDEQQAALRPSPPGGRRIVLATDIAETSLTVDGVAIVVDSGLARAPRFDPGTGLTRLATITTSRDSADQRAGRAGRLGPGVCYRLWSKVEHGSRLRHRRPEISDVDLAGLVLDVAAWGTPIDQLRWATPPPTSAVRSARALLADLHALDDDRITDVGRRLQQFGVHPRLGRLLVAEPTSLGCVLAAVLDERDVLRGRPGDLPVDLALRIDLVAGRTRDDRADRAAVGRVRDRADDLARRVGIRLDLGAIDSSRAGGALIAAYPERIAARRRPGQFQFRTGSAAWVGTDDPVAHDAFLVAPDVDPQRRGDRIRRAAVIDADDVTHVLGDAVVESSTLVWDGDRDDLVEVVARRLDGMQLGETRRRPAPSEATTAALLDRVRATGLAVLGWSDRSLSIRRRVDFLHREVGSPWPDWSVDALAGSLDEWLAPYLPGAVGRRDLEGLDVAMVLRSQLPWPEGADLDRVAPPRLDLPTGRWATIDYSGDAPTAAVRVQDLFGTTEHPTAGGRPIVLELLSPADRPIQVTADLPGFWAGSWADVRKELAGRYPKHQWPADPATAAPRRLKDR